MTRKVQKQPAQTHCMHGYSEKAQSCLTCHKLPNECDWGACQDKDTRKTIKTRLHPYEFNLDNQEQNQAYLDLKDSIRHIQGSKEPMPALRHPAELLDNGVLELELELNHLFADQWNTAPGHGSKNGYRVFNWAENIYEDKRIKRGYYLEITEEMREALRNTSACGYCGKQEPSAKGLVFCDKCLGSPYLKETELHLTRMRPINQDHKPREPLTEAEKAWLIPQYVEAQTIGRTEADKKRLKAEREAVEAKHTKALIAANEEHKGMMFLLDHGFRLDNVIYYSHTGRFCFGWRTPIGKETWARLNEILSEFPCSYDVKTDFSGVKSGE
jgi:hypothetical protein